MRRGAGNLTFDAGFKYLHSSQASVSTQCGVGPVLLRFSGFGRTMNPVKTSKSRVNPA